MRAAGAAVLVAAAATVLTSCSALGGTPAAAAGGASAGPVLDPSIPSATPTEQVASDTPAPIGTPSSDATAAPTTAADARTAVVPYITTADWDATARSIDVAAIVPGIVEGGGSCVVTLTSGSTTRTATGGGVAASSYTGCEAVTFKAVPAGAWTVRVRYDSTKASGSSAVRTVQAG